MTHISKQELLQGAQSQAQARGTLGPSRQQCLEMASPGLTHATLILFKIESYKIAADKLSVQQGDISLAAVPCSGFGSFSGQQPLSVSLARCCSPTVI